MGDVGEGGVTESDNEMVGEVAAVNVQGKARDGGREGKAARE